MIDQTISAICVIITTNFFPTDVRKLQKNVENVFHCKKSVLFYSQIFANITAVMICS